MNDPQVPTKPKVLFVDDDVSLLAAITRNLRREFDLATACNPAEGLSFLQNSGEVEVIVCDMHLQTMDGVEFFRRSQQFSPSSSRIMLTGSLDQKTAVDAVNVGRVFRFLNKPTPVDEIRRAIFDGLKRRSEANEDHKLHMRTLASCIKSLADALSVVNPNAFERASRARRIAGQIAARIDNRDVKTIELATMLSQIGWLTGGDPSIPNTEDEVQRALSLSRQIVDGMPKLESVGEILRQYQEDVLIGSTRDDWEARLAEDTAIIRLAIDYTDRVLRGEDPLRASHELGQQEWRYGNQALSALQDDLENSFVPDIVEVAPDDIAIGAILADDLFDSKGCLLMKRGQEVTEPLRNQLLKIERSRGLGIVSVFEITSTSSFALPN